MCKVVANNIRIEDTNKNKNFEEFKRDLELQEKRVYEKINPILQLYVEREIDKKEFVEKLIEAFYSLEKE